MAGGQLTTKRVERSAEATGKIVQAAAEQDAEAILSGKALPLVAEAEPIDKLYVTLDGTGVPMLPRETAGRRGKGPHGRARTREVKLGCVFTLRPRWTPMATLFVTPAPPAMYPASRASTAHLQIWVTPCDRTRRCCRP